MSDKQLDLHTHLSKVCIYAVPVHHTLMRQLFRQQACESIRGRCHGVRSCGINVVSWTSERQRQTGRDFTLSNEEDFSHFMAK